LHSDESLIIQLVDTMINLQWTVGVHGGAEGLNLTILVYNGPTTIGTQAVIANTHRYKFCTQCTFSYFILLAFYTAVWIARNFDN